MGFYYTKWNGVLQRTLVLRHFLTTKALQNERPPNWTEDFNFKKEPIGKKNPGWLNFIKKLDYFRRIAVTFNSYHLLKLKIFEAELIYKYKSSPRAACLLL